jgi:hypothetical protein
MKIDKRQYTKTEARVQSIDIRGPLFIAGYSEKYTPTYLSVRTKKFFHGNLRNLKINEKQIDWLAPRSTIGTSEFYQIPSNLNGSFPNSPATVKRTFEIITSSSNDGIKSGLWT